MIPMSCPSCGRKGSVPNDRVNTRMHCKKCDAVFHMDKSGRVLLGEPESERIAREKAAAEAAADQPFDLIGALAGSRVARAVGLLLLIGIIGSLGANPLMRTIRSFGPPTDLEGRSKYVAEAFIDQDFKRLQRVVAPGTEDDARAWVAKVRPTIDFQGPQSKYHDVLPMISLASVADLGPGGHPDTIAELMLPQALVIRDVGLDPDEEPEPLPQVRLCWVIAADGQPLLDGKATLAAADRAPARKEKKAARSEYAAKTEPHYRRGK